MCGHINSARRRKPLSVILDRNSNFRGVRYWFAHVPCTRRFLVFGTLCHLLQNVWIMSMAADVYCMDKGSANLFISIYPFHERSLILQ